MPTHLKPWGSWVLVMGSALMLAACGASTSQSTPHPRTSANAVGRITHFTSPPPTVIKAGRQYQATVTTSLGTFVIHLFARRDPQAVNNFVFLAEHKFFNTERIFRVLKTFVFQTGDPQNTGVGGPGYELPAELPITVPYGPGVVAYAHTASSNDYGSQFFVCTGSDSSVLNQTPTYTEIGKVVSGMSVVTKIAGVPVKVNPVTQEDSMPVSPITIDSVTISSRPASAS